MVYLTLFWTFFKIGAFTVGGGYAMLPLIQKEVESHGWIASELVVNFVAISESTPGPFAVNMATYVGFHSFGIIGSLVGPLALVFPSVVIIVIISKILNKFKESKMVQDVFYGLRPASTGLIIAAGLGVAKIALLHLDNFLDTKNILNLFNYKAIILAAVIYFIMKKKDFHPILMVVFAAVIGIVFKF